MFTQLISKTTFRAAVVGNPDSIFVLPNNHRVAVQLNTTFDSTFNLYPIGDYLKEWSANLGPKATVAEYAAAFMAYVNQADQTPEFRSEAVWEALATYFGQSKFHQEPTDFHFFDLAEDRPALSEFDFVALEDTRNFDLILKDLERLPFAVKDQTSPLAKVAEHTLRKVLSLANPDTNEFFAQDFGERILKLVDEYGTRILAWYQRNFETMNHITFIGFGTEEFEPQATHIRFGGALGSIQLIEYSDPFKEVWLQDTTYPKRWYGDREEELMYFENELEWRLHRQPWLPASATLELTQLKRAAKRFLSDFEPEPITLVDISKESITQS